MRRILALPLLVCSMGAQAPRVGDIDFYGLRRVTTAEILKATGIEPGGPLPPSKGDLESKLEQLPNVVEARVEAVCCEGDRTALFIGIAEKGAPSASFRSEPSGEAALPQELLDKYRQFLIAVQRASARGNAGEDLTAGHSMMDDPAARTFQTEFVYYAKAHLDQLEKALHQSSDPDTRAAAVAIMGYGPKTQNVANELQFALADPDPAVRANAIRGLSAFIVYSQKRPEAGLKIEPTWFVELLHSVDLRDRIESAKALALMTEAAAPPAMRQAAIDLIRERALADVAEMARWRTLRYALPPFLMMGRIAGLKDGETQQAWAKGDREAIVQKALDTALPKASRTRK
jgi:hypothetical protein